MMHLVDMEEFRRSILNAERFFNLTVLWTKVISFLALKLSDEAQFNKEINDASEIEEVLDREIENALAEEIENVLVSEFEMSNVLIGFTLSHVALHNLITDKNVHKMALEMEEKLGKYIHIEESKNDIDIIDLMVLKIISVLRKTRMLVILDTSKLAEEITKFLLRLDNDTSSNDAKKLAKHITRLVKNNAGISAKNSKFNDNTHKRKLINAVSLRIVNRYTSVYSKEKDENSIIVNVMSHVLKLGKMNFLNDGSVEEIVEKIKDEIKAKNIEGYSIDEWILNIMKETDIAVYSSVGASLIKENFRHIYKIIRANNSQEDEEDPVFKNYYNFLQFNDASGVITTAGLRTANSRSGFFGSLEGEVDKAIRDDAFVDEDLVSNWSTQQAKEILGKSNDKAFLCSMAQMVRRYSGDVGGLPIACTIDDWKTKADISSLYKMADSVKLISLWPAPELLQLTSWVLEKHVLVVNMETPVSLIFRSKRPDFYYSLCYVVLETLAESWNISVEDLIEQMPSLSENETVEIEIGTKTYWDTTEGIEKTEKWYAWGHIIHRPAKRS